MKTIHYQIQFFSYWHVGTGLYGGTKADMVVNKSPENLPFIPGKTLKGLLREAAESIYSLHGELVSYEFIADIFGLGPESPEESREDAQEAKAFFANAYLSEALRRSILPHKMSNLQTSPDMSSYLYNTISSTKIDHRGLAEEQSLRTKEVTIPVCLHSTIESFPDNPAYEKQLEYCMKWVKRLGVNRNRGLGRCRFSINKLTKR